VDSATWPTTDASGLTQIPDVRGTRLGKLADSFAAGEKTVTRVVSRTVDSKDKNSAVSAMMFQSAI
jgi:hypothetical protein